jgi:RNA polymerase sigma factor (TIGR02999 family)
MTAARQEITRLVTAIGAGDENASSALLPLLYDELRELARSWMHRLPPGQTLQPTALVHEAYVRLTCGGDPSWNGRGHFFASAAEAMRQILVDQARRKSRLKRGGDRRRADLEAADPAIEAPTEGLLELDDMVSDMERDDPRKARIVKLRYFAGMTVDETAAALELSEATVRRDCRYVKAVLAARLEDRRAGG